MGDSMHKYNDPNQRSYTEIFQEKQDDENKQSESSLLQTSIENKALKLYKLNEPKTHQPTLMKEKHIKLLKESIHHLDKDYEKSDCSRTWLCYWILHSLNILDARLDNNVNLQIVGFLAKCQSRKGGFGGGPGLLPHLGSTYAAVNALCSIGSLEAYQVINRVTLKKFLLSRRQEDGSFSMHEDGEVDMRGVYCALAVASLTNIYTRELFKDTANFILKCQTWDGGFGGYPGMEAHGGYTYCAITSLRMLGELKYCRLRPLMRWLVNRQMSLEGGFQGRPNKPVDACYSFWQGACFPIIDETFRNLYKLNSDYWLYDQKALQEFLLFCCQFFHGGMADTPGDKSDIYHTCYGLSGLSIAQMSPQPLIIGTTLQSMLKLIHPLYNLEHTWATRAISYFKQNPIS
ncbi:protein farnesyltransferase subunit beta isoform X2 [Colletes gigas]|uniref:protein farnesyltransferase subunit beta isoform X2 n=1 Tax=Colletes gigas TaxID=935657 RepID=UPI001C9BA4B5|nr:protein farnesyltransferase subunit beta isoform X2 [Colletes gigas]XP_043266277.1 protein farnesyltransferase subunit beta isoform X2 [Colletes gigas]